MIDPNAHGELILSFVSERYQRQIEERRTKVRRSPNLSFRRRALALAGSALITLGTALKESGTLNTSHPPVMATSMENK